MSRWVLAGLALAGVVATSGAMAQRERVSAECRRAVVQLCGLSGGRAGIRDCLTQRARQLPEACQIELLDRAAKAQASAARLPANAREVAFGSDPKQRLDFWPAQAAGNRPLVVFVHGGGWSIGDKRAGTGAKSTHFPAKGYAFASLNYRLVPQVTPAEQAADIAAALAVLRKQPGVDPDRIVIMGHSAGAHLVALVGTDPRYLAGAGIPMAAVRGVIPIDGAGYDVVKQMQSPRNLVGSMYKAAFTTDPKRQAALSPVTHAAAPNAADWLIINDAGRPDSQEQSALLTAALAKAGARVERMPVENTNHMLLNRNVGVPGDAETARIDAFVARVAG